MRVLAAGPLAAERVHQEESARVCTTGQGTHAGRIPQLLGKLDAVPRALSEPAVETFEFDRELTQTNRQHGLHSEKAVDH